MLWSLVPALDPWLAVGLCVLFLVLFVGLLYVTAAGRGDRDSPEAIRARFVSVAATCVLSGLLVWWAAPWSAGSFWPLVGLEHTRGWYAASLPLLATLCLFAGPLVQSVWVDGDDWSLHHLVTSQVGGGTSRKRLIWLRNFVVAPLAEEWVFRACMCPLLRLAGFSFVTCVLLPPLLFGLAHAHHVAGVLRERGRVGVAAVLPVMLFQVAYTTVFGSMAAYYFLCSGSIYGSMASHAFCNTMGFPDFGGAWASRRRWLLVVVYIVGLVLFTALMIDMYDVTLESDFLQKKFPAVEMAY
jgi:prenyl protein peptidase